jgi:hypothetical protein
VQAGVTIPREEKLAFNKLENEALDERILCQSVDPGPTSHIMGHEVELGFTSTGIERRKHNLAGKVLPRIVVEMINKEYHGAFLFSGVI